MITDTPPIRGGAHGGVGAGGDVHRPGRRGRAPSTSLAPGASVAMLVRGNALPDAVAGDTVSNAATVSAATPDTDPADNATTATVTVGPRRTAG